MGHEEVMRPEDTTAREDMYGEVRLRIPLVIVIPLAALALIAALAIGFSRVLLELPPEAATAIAIVTAANLLIASAFLALRRVERVGALEVILIALYPVLIGVVLAQVGFGEESTSAGEPAAVTNEGGGATSGDGTEIVAQSLQFDTESIELPAKKETDYTLVNEDTVTHDLAIFESEQDATGGGKPLFQSPDVDAGAEETFTISPLDKGEYFFLCTFHPTQMTGSVEVR